MHLYIKLNKWSDLYLSIILEDEKYNVSIYSWIIQLKIERMWTLTNASMGRLASWEKKLVPTQLVDYVTVFPPVNAQKERAIHVY